LKITFKNRKLEKTLTDPTSLAKSHGSLAKKIHQRLTELGDAESLEVMKTILAAKCHELSGSKKGEFAVTISANFRLIFEPNHQPIPRKPDGGLDWKEITDIQVNEIIDYH
jgi:plasmid maintenance system killer protein